MRELPNAEILEYLTMTDIIEEDGCCAGVKAQSESRGDVNIYADFTIFACGGVGGNYDHSTNYPHLTGDGLRIAEAHGIRLENTDCVQIHPTTLYSEKPGRRFLISESVRGEGALLYGRDGKRFVDELQPRDVVTEAIRKQMEKDKMPYVWLSMEPLGEETILRHFPNIHRALPGRGIRRHERMDSRGSCAALSHGGNLGGFRQPDFDAWLFAVGETSCNGVHGMNRLASNSLLESLVFAKRAAGKIAGGAGRRKGTCRGGRKFLKRDDAGI